MAFVRNATILTNFFLLDTVKGKVIGGSLESPWWLLLGFCSKILGGGGDLQMVLCVSMNAGSVVGTLKSYLMQRISFELSALTASQETKT